MSLSDILTVFICLCVKNDLQDYLQFRIHLLMQPVCVGVYCRMSN